VSARQPGELRWETRLLAVITATLTVFGIATTYGASSLTLTRAQDVVGADFALKQLSGAVVGGVFLLIAARMDYRRWRLLAWPLLVATVVLLLIPLMPFTYGIAPRINGARRWVHLGLLNLQPSELARVAIVIWCAMLAAKKGEQVRQFKNGVMPFLLVLGLVSLLILLQPNMSMAVLVGLLGSLVLFTAGARIGHFILLGLAVVPLALFQLQTRGYRWARVRDFLEAGNGRGDTMSQIHQSLVGIGSGGILGTGFGQGQQKLGYLPYAYSDFLFSTIGEEWGFIGVVFLVLLFALFCWVGLRIARTAEDPFGQYLATGLTAAVGVTAFLHMAVSLGLMPTTGLTLPFMSYGRSSLVISLIGTGILINVGRARGKPAPRGRTDGLTARRTDGRTVSRTDSR
jgi:cell division protein FtsW